MASKVKRRRRPRRREVFWRSENAAPTRFNGHWEYWFFDPTYRENIHVLWPVNDEQLTAYVAKRICPKQPYVSEGETWGGRTLQAKVDGHNHTIIAFRKFDGSSFDCACIAHEAFHAASDILDARGADFCRGPNASNEHYAYLLERIYLMCHKAMASTRKMGGG